MSLKFLVLKNQSPASPRGAPAISFSSSAPTNHNVQNSKEVLLQRLQEVTRSIKECIYLSDTQIKTMHVLANKMAAVSRQGRYIMNKTIPLSTVENNKRSLIRGRQHRGRNRSEPSSSPITPQRFFRTSSTARNLSTSPLRSRGNNSARPSVLDDVFKTPPAYMSTESPLPRIDYCKMETIRNSIVRVRTERGKNYIQKLEAKTNLVMKDSEEMLVKLQLLAKEFAQRKEEVELINAAVRHGLYIVPSPEELYMAEYEEKNNSFT